MNLNRIIKGLVYIGKLEQLLIVWDYTLVRSNRTYSVCILICKLKMLIIPKKICKLKMLIIPKI